MVVRVLVFIGFFLLLDCRYFYFCIIHVVHGLSVGRLTSDVKYCIKMKIETGSISKGKNLTKEVKLLKTTNGSGSSTQLDNPADSVSISCSGRGKINNTYNEFL